jgi:16S rRNA (cytosine967-C5)-methyltransferase
LPRPADARECAFAVLDAYRASQTFVNRLLEDQLDASNLGPADRRLATELVYGIVRRQSTLDALIAPNVTRPRAQVEPRLWTILQLGAYQLAFLESIPAHAALNETVNLARWIGRAGATGFLNGVLRAVQRDLTDEHTNAPAANALPLSGGRYRRLTADRFADPVTDPQGYLVRAFSDPRWLARRWIERFGFDEAVRLADWFNTPPRLTLRVNRLKTGRESLLAEL